MEEQLQRQRLQTEQHLTQLRTWDVQQDQTLEQRRMQQKDVLLQRQQEDIGWLKQYYQNLAPTQAQQIAPGQPIQELPTPKLSLEEKRRNKEKRNQAKNHHTEANEQSFDIAKALEQRKKDINNSMNTVGGYGAVHGHGYDCRVLLDFCQSYKVDKAGNPATEEDARKMREDKQFIEDYDSRDAQRIKPHLDRCVDEILRIELHDWMFEAPYVIEHAAELRSAAQKLLLIQNLRDDNPEYFEQLRQNDPLKYGLLDAQDYMGTGISTKLLYAFQTRCVDLNNDTYLDANDSPTNYEGLKDVAPVHFATAQENRKERADAAVQSEIDKRIEQRRQEIAQQREELLRENNEAALKIQKSGLTADNKPDSASTVLKYQDMILNNRERYAANQVVADRAYAELFKAIDTKDDMMTQIRCTVTYAEEFDPDSAEFNIVQQYAEKREAELKQIVKNIGVQIECLENLLKHILRGDQLEASGTVAATRFGYHQQIENLPRTEQDEMDNAQYRSIRLDEQGKEQVNLYTKEDQNITMEASAIQKEKVVVTDPETQMKKKEEVEIAQTSAQYSYAYKTQASAIGRMLWMSKPPHADQLAKTHAKLSALGSKMYEPIEIRGKDKQARLESAGDQIVALQDEIGAAIKSCEDYVKLKFGWGKKKKAAKVLVEETLKILREDYKKLDGQVAQLMYRASSGEMTFGELLSDARSDVIDLDREKEKLGKTGANMSEVITVGEGADMKFYKDEEPLVSTVDIYKQKFMSTKEGWAKYGKLLPVLIDAQNLCLKKKRQYPSVEMITNEISGLITGYAEAVKNGTVEAYDRRTESMVEFYDGELDQLGLSIQEFCALLKEVSPELAKSVVGFENMTANAKISVGSNIAMRNVATSRMASLLGVGDLVVKSTNAIVQEQGKRMRKGIVMEKARGQAMASLDSKKVKTTYTPDAVRQLVNLHLLDLICGQTDRHMNNYFVTTNQQGQIDGIQGIDNDVAFGELSGKDLMQANGCLDGLKIMRLPVVDEDMYDSICSLTEEVLKVNFADLLSEKEIKAMADRIRTVQDYLTNRIKNGSLVKVEKGQWTAEHTEAFKKVQKSTDDKGRNDVGMYNGYVQKGYL